MAVIIEFPRNFADRGVTIIDAAITVLVYAIGIGLSPVCIFFVAEIVEKAWRLFRG